MISDSNLNYTIDYNIIIDCSLDFNNYLT